MERAASPCEIVRVISSVFARFLVPASSLLGYWVLGIPGTWKVSKKRHKFVFGAIVGSWIPFQDDSKSFLAPRKKKIATSGYEHKLMM